MRYTVFTFAGTVVICDHNGRIIAYDVRVYGARLRTTAARLNHRRAAA